MPPRHFSRRSGKATVHLQNTESPYAYSSAALSVAHSTPTGGERGGLGGTASRRMISRGALPGADFNVQGGDIYNGAPALLFINPNTLPTWGI